MKRVTLTVVAILLAAPAAASAKTGIEFDKYPEKAKVGEKQSFSIIVLREPRDPSSGGPTPIVGMHPLVTFRSESGRVIRVRGSAANGDGIARASVAFPDNGPWTTDVSVPGAMPSDAQPFSVGIGLTQTIVSGKPPAPASGDGGFPWVWVLSIASILAAVSVAAARFGLMPRRLRGLLGGGA